MSVDVEADIAAYARQQHAERAKKYRAAHPDRNRTYRARHKQPIRIEYTPPPTRAPVPDWRTQLDARITRCPSCDQWCWDRMCQHCLTQTARTTRRTAA